MNWDNFFLAQAGAAAGLSGLIFVAVSINLNAILNASHLPDRALQSLTLLLNILVISSLMLVPAQPVMIQGIEIIALSVVLFFITLRLAFSMLKATPDEYKKHSRNNLILTQFTVLLFMLSGGFTLMIGEKGIYLLVPAILLSFLKAIADAWVLLVEINR